MKHGIGPRFDPEELDDLSDQELIELQEYAENESPLTRTYTESDYEYIVHEIVQRFRDLHTTDNEGSAENSAAA